MVLSVLVRLVISFSAALKKDRTEEILVENEEKNEVTWRNLKKIGENWRNRRNLLKIEETWKYLKKEDTKLEMISSVWFIVYVCSRPKKVKVETCTFFCFEEGGFEERFGERTD